MKKKILCFGGEKSSSWVKKISSFHESSAKLEWCRCFDISWCKKRSNKCTSGGKALFNPLVLVLIFCCGIQKSFEARDVIIFHRVSAFARRISLKVNKPTKMP